MVAHFLHLFPLPGERVLHSTRLQDSRAEEPLTPTLSPQERGEGAHLDQRTIRCNTATSAAAA